MVRNPSLALGIWGPLVPANDCKPGMFTLIGLQFAGSVLLWKLPGRNPNKPRLLNLALRTSGAVLGTYLGLGALTETSRQFISYDAWIADAVRARKEEDNLRKKKSYSSLENLRYWWFGPKNYKPVNFDVYKRRTVDALNSVKESDAVLDSIKLQRTLAFDNLNQAAKIRKLLESGELKPPAQNPQEVEALKSLPITAEEEKIIYDSLYLRGNEFWIDVGNSCVPYMTIIPKLALYLQPGVDIDTNLMTKKVFLDITPHDIPRK